MRHAPLPPDVLVSALQERIHRDSGVSRAARAVRVSAAALALVGCGGSLGAAKAGDKLGAAPPSARCQTLDDRHTTWSAVAQGAAVLGGGSGVATLADLGPDYRAPVAVTAVAAGALAAVAVAVSDGAAESWARECSR